MIGRIAEIKKLETAYHSNRAKFVVVYGRRLFVYHPPTAGSALSLYPALLRKGIHSALHGGSGNTEFHCQTDLSRLGIRAKLLDDANPQRGIGLRISLISLRISLIEANLSQRQDHCRAVWPERLFDVGSLEAAIPPRRIDVRDPASGPFRIPLIALLRGSR